MDWAMTYSTGNWPIFQSVPTEKDLDVTKTIMKEGDKVEATSSYNSVPVGEKGTLLMDNKEGADECMYVSWDNLALNNTCHCGRGARYIYAKYLKVISSKPSVMKKLTNAFKKFLSADLQSQVKAGFRGSNLELTDEGKEALFEILAEENKEALTAAADEAIAETEAEEAKK